MYKKVKFKKGAKHCPECGNNKEFTLRKDHMINNLCEVWVECKCGYSVFKRTENIWNGIDDEYGFILWNKEIL